MTDIKHPTVPIEYAGKWIAWDHAMTRIVASADSLTEVLEAAHKAGEPDPILDKVPPANMRLIGRRLRSSFPTSTTRRTQHRRFHPGKSIGR